MHTLFSEDPNGPFWNQVGGTVVGGGFLGLLGYLLYLYDWSMKARAARRTLDAKVRADAAEADKIVKLADLEVRKAEDDHDTTKAEFWQQTAEHTVARYQHDFAAMEERYAKQYAEQVNRIVRLEQQVVDMTAAARTLQIRSDQCDRLSAWQGRLILILEDRVREVVGILKASGQTVPAHLSQPLPIQEFFHVDTGGTSSSPSHAPAN